MTVHRNYSPLDHFLIQADLGLRTLLGNPIPTDRPDPALTVPEADLTEAERREAARLMRINHTGEVCAQALYQGQALTARSDEVKRLMQESAAEENDHLLWCERRLEELDSRTSYLNPFFYIGSLTLGAVAGLAGDKWSLGFLAETERQVEAHLDGHLTRLPETDDKSRAVVEQMKEDERKHATTATNAGGAELPLPVRQLMRLASKVMTKTTYWV
ncbi:MAG TPA: 2-polyprenyl-3-methyl-6-methoxy-1,4-benzoquinone monooxygenase [Gammaproteobacteria bacterium]|nr:2-polyprenyl-3-methyl-6-methoxy-1,4-benzoquinone monooxygenase [Gammaproteobacteria bacterium]